MEKIVCQVWIGMQTTGMSKTIVHKGIFLGLFATFMKNAEDHPDSSFLTSIYCSPHHVLL